MKGKISITLEDRLIERIDRERGLVPRSAAIEEMIVHAYSCEVNQHAFCNE